MNGPLLIDTGPLVASLNRRDRYYEWTVEQLQASPGPLLTCEAVLSEAFFLLGNVPNATEELWGILTSGAIETDFALRREQKAVSKLMLKYADAPMSLADACLVRMSELFPDRSVLTLDSHFQIYRRRRNAAIPTVMPSQ